MPVRYQIVKTNLSEEAKYIGRVSLTDCYNLEMLVGRMLRMGSSLTKPDILATLKLLESAVEMICSEGSRVSLDGFVSFTPTMSGAFASESASYSAAQNSIYITSSVAKSFNETFIKNVSLEKLAPSEKKPYFYRVEDLISGETNKTVTPGGIVTLHGERLKFDPENPEEYLRFVNAADTSKFVEFSLFQKVAGKEIVIQLPEVNFSQGYFEIGSTMNTKTVRIGRSQDLTVGA